MRENICLCNVRNICSRHDCTAVTSLTFCSAFLAIWRGTEVGLLFFVMQEIYFYNVIFFRFKHKCSTCLLNPSLEVLYVRSLCIARSGFKCFVTYCWPEHENHVCQVFSIESHGIQQSHHIMGGKTVHPGMISNFATGSLSSFFYHR